MSNMMLTLQQALSWVPDAQLLGDGRVTVQRAHTDTRTIEPGDLFVAIKGERFDGDDFWPRHAPRVPSRLCAIRLTN
jgi:UDP-N-acetylmuramoyl-tripeptide--D-alanyl-D-alanine ligase